MLGPLTVGNSNLLKPRPCTPEPVKPSHVGARPTIKVAPGDGQGCEPGLPLSIFSEESVEDWQ